MGQTTLYLLPYPEPAEVADVPADMKKLADKVDGLLRPPSVTTLPSSPTDGQEVYYKLASGGYWHLRYGASNAGSYKWDAVGSSAPLSAAGAGGQTVNSGGAGTFIAWPSGPQITLPLGGIYRYSFQFGWQLQTAALSEADVRVQTSAGVPITPNKAKEVRTTQWQASVTHFEEAASMGAAGTILQLGVATSVSIALLGADPPPTMLLTPIQVG
jgi:hypothetical protein